MDLIAPFTAEDLPEALREIAEGQLTGELVAEGSQGRKSILISQGQMSVTSEGGQKLRLGDILLVRGKVTQEELAEGLAVQNERGGSRLGDVLCELGYVTRGEIDEVVQFQLEEELCDLFTWEDASFQFAEGAVGPVEGSATTTLSIDPTQIIVEAARRVNTWNQIKRRIPSMHVVYLLTSRGERMFSSATRGGRKLLELVSQSETVDAIAQKTFLGRFATCRSLMELLEAGSIEPVPDEELPELAESLEVEGWLEQAKGVYARIYELEEDPSTQEAISAHIAELDSIAYEREPELAPVREFAIEQPPTLGWLTAGLFVALMFLTLIAISSIPRVKAFWLGENAAPFREAEARAMVLEGEGAFATAADAYLNFSEIHSRSVFAGEARRRARELFKRYEALARPSIAQAEDLAAKGKESEAIQAFRGVLRDFPRTARSREILQKIRELSRARAKRLRILPSGDVRRILDEAKLAFGSGERTRAQALLNEVAEATCASPADALEADKLLGALAKKERELFGLVAEAENAASQENDKAAVEALRRVVKEWPDSSPGFLASDLLEVLQREKLRAFSALARAKTLLAEKDRLFSEGKIVEAKVKEAEAVPVLVRAARYGHVDEGKEARRILEELISSQRELGSLLGRAKRAKAEKRFDEAFRITYELARRPECAAVLDQLVLEYSIQSVPRRATVVIGEKDVRTTPHTLGLRPNERALIRLSMVGFDDQRFVVDPKENSERVIRKRLNKRIFAKRELGAPARLARLPAGRTVFALAGRKLVAVQAGGTTARWSFELPGESGEPVVAGDRVSVLVGKKVFSFRASQRLPQSVELPGRCLAPPMVAELRRLAGLIFAYASPAETEVIYAIEVAEKKKKWTTGLAGKLLRPPLWGDDRLHLASTGALSCLDGATGKKLWSLKLSSRPGDGPVLCGEAVAVCLSGGEVLACARADGSRLVFSELGARTVVGGDDAVFAAGRGRLSRIELAGGKLAWTVELEPVEPVYGTYSAGELYIGGSDGLLQCINASTGELEWQTKVDGAISPYPVVVGDSVHFVRQPGEFCLVKRMERMERR